MLDWKRKRPIHSSSCLDCYRCHRACDGNRPCSRCNDLGRAASCRDPESSERILRKRKKSKSSDERIGERRPKISFFVVDPQMFASPKPSINICLQESPALSPPLNHQANTKILQPILSDSLPSGPSRQHQTQLSRTFEESPSVEELLRDIFLEIDDVREDQNNSSSNSEFNSLPMPNDLVPFCGSLFMPFVLQDSIQVLFILTTKWTFNSCFRHSRSL